MNNDYFNTGSGFQIQPIDIGHNDYVGLVSADTAFWTLVKKDKLGEVLTQKSILAKFHKKKKSFLKDIHTLRFGLKPSAVYFNPTDKCNLNCSYCYIPEHLRKNGKNMPVKSMIRALEILKDYFKSTVPKGRKPQIVFHGAEPMLNKEAVFFVMEKFSNDFQFGVQTNGTLLDDEAIKFLTEREISIGLSLDGHIAGIADKLRKNWNNKGVFSKVVHVINKLKGYSNYSVICTVTKENMGSLNKIVEFLHKMEVSNCMLNPVRCTLSGGRKNKPDDLIMSKYYLDALDKTHQLYKRTGRKLIVANFANILLAILAPTARHLMCDISPCGGGRCFFAVSSRGDMFPCSEFIGLKKFRGGNLFRDNIAKVLKTNAFKAVTERTIEKIDDCATCAIRHFCGAPCPAEAYEINGNINTKGAFCDLYEEQVRYAFRLIADTKENDFLWDNWDKELKTSLDITH